VSDLSTRPYLIRAIYEWCSDSGLTPYLAVHVDEHTQVPRSHVKDGEIVLNISSSAVRNLLFGGASFDLLIPVAAVTGIYARETGQGLMFQGGEPDQPPPARAQPGGHQSQAGLRRPQLKIVK